MEINWYYCCIYIHAGYRIRRHGLDLELRLLPHTPHHRCDQLRGLPDHCRDVLFDTLLHFDDHIDLALQGGF